MSKQLNFYATESDKIMISEILNSVFGELLDIPFNKGSISSFDPKINKSRFYLTEKNRMNDVIYHIHEYYDNSTAELLDYRKSPILEYSISLKNEEGTYIRGRFYCCSEDMEFSKKVSKFFFKLKKEFWYIKKWKTHISKNIDIENSSFFIPNETIKISKEDFQ